MAKKIVKRDEDIPFEGKTDEDIDYPRLVFLAIKNIITAQNPTAYTLGVTQYEKLLSPFRDKEYIEDVNKIAKAHERRTRIKNPSNMRVIMNLLVMRASEVFEALMFLAKRRGFLGEEEITFTED